MARVSKPYDDKVGDFRQLTQNVWKRLDEAEAEVERLRARLDRRVGVTLLMEDVGTAVEPEIDADKVVAILNEYRRRALEGSSDE